MNDVAVAEELAGLGEQFHDELLTPEHPAYDEARKLYNAMIDKRPALIARCRDAADVIAAVELRPRQRARLAIRGGGHNGGGLGSVDDGLVDRPVGDERRASSIPPRAPRPSAAARCLATSTTRRARSASRCRPGSSSTTGVGGLTLGGGTATSPAATG